MPGLLLAFGLSLVPRPALKRGSRESIQGMLRLLGRAYLPTLGVFRPPLVLFRMLFSRQLLSGLRSFDGFLGRIQPIERTL
jgi:hypothetical protein